MKPRGEGVLLPYWSRLLLFCFCGLVCFCPRSKAQARTEEPAFPACAGPRWIVNAGSLNRSRRDFPLTLQRRFFDNSCTFLVTGPHLPRSYRGWNAILTRSTPSLSGVMNEVGSPKVRVILYDPEDWPMTPRNERIHPVASVCRAARIAHAYHKWLIATPAVDLLKTRSRGGFPHDRRFQAFERTGWIGAMARCADVVEIQAQGAEGNTSLFKRFVVTEARQVRRANPHVLVLAGISTNPDGQHIRFEKLLRAVRAVRSVVDGFWLNIPAAGRYCPRCGRPRPILALKLMQRFMWEAGEPPRQGESEQVDGRLHRLGQAESVRFGVGIELESHAWPRPS